MQAELRPLGTRYTMLRFDHDAGGQTGSQGAGTVAVTAVLDPLTEAAQRVAPLLPAATSSRRFAWSR